jgi:predicted secreted acid phosphatase
MGLTTGTLLLARDRFYDFNNIFAEKNAKKMAFLTQNKAKLFKNVIITLVFEKNANFLQKMGKNSRIL